MHLSRRYVAATWVATGVFAVGLLAQAPVPAGKSEPAAQARPATPSDAAKEPPTVPPASPAPPSSKAPSSEDTVGPDEVVLTIGPEKNHSGAFRADQARPARAVRGFGAQVGK